ncbi:receptor for retinol uptake stra6 isoform X1 [Xiphophorus couchianus]|uniref:receptor for retinol uptake stra6 isoform X1 n=1 Tax=Xiphophorus couchianus TaxID=32473 RepID=UPI001016E2C2|nr:receptor for retinol uptake STRA6 isoform X1 [Xiphophorus couchianus]XP_027881663.1 receptor for retinol uptake STRA6 isoform X1 [Xiphophorus couchianus]XP_027881668.1 receptor for retinol uptake STRA6 isoform X1 [Xiphophorus couchianus]XP_027881677.1 receptor for retinol uptake STRA6 isoform X1 [Xiphophorus couchianus]
MDKDALVDYEYPDLDPLPSKIETETIPPCDPTADDMLYHICITAISLVIMLILAILARRTKVGKRQKGLPGLLSPVNFLDHTQHKGLAVAVFGVLLCKLWGLLISTNPLPFTTDSTNKQNWVILGVFYYPALYYPLLACGTLHNKVGYVLGSLLSWTHFGVLVWQKIDCPKTPLIHKHYSLFSSLPQIACLAFLSFQYPLLLFKGFKGAERTNATEDLSSSYYRDYVKTILYEKMSSKVSTSSTDKPKLPQRVTDAVRSYIYTPEEAAFRFPLKLAISCVVSFITLYQMGLVLISAVVPTMQKARFGVDEDIANVLAGFQIILSPDRKEVVRIVVYYMWCVEVCYISAMTLSCLVNLVLLMRSMVLHRSNLKGLYRGDIYNVYNCQRTIRASRPALVCWMGYTSFTAAHICIGMIIQTLVFFLCLMVAVFLIIIPILHRQNLILFQIVLSMWPFWLMILLAVVLQHITARFCFIKKTAGTRDLTNRGNLFLLTYLLFPVNVLIGVLLAIWRMIITALFNIVHMGRMDIGLLNRNVEAFDPAYRCYAHYLKIEVSQSHPVMKAFCGILLQSLGQESKAAQKSRDAEEGIQLVQQEKKLHKVSSAKRARMHWQLLYTLVNNPSLVGTRKHFQLQTADNFLNGSLNRTSKQGSKKEAIPKEAEAAAASN